MSSQFDAAGVVGSLGRERRVTNTLSSCSSPASSVEEEHCLAPASSVEEEHDVHMGGGDALTDQEGGAPLERLEEAVGRVDNERREGVVSAAAVSQLCDAHWAMQDEHEELRTQHEELRTQLSVAQGHVASMAAEIAAQAALRAAGDGASKRTPAAEAKASTEGPPVEAAAPLHTPRPPALVASEHQLSRALHRSSTPCTTTHVRALQGRRLPQHTKAQMAIEWCP